MDVMQTIGYELGKAIIYFAMGFVVGWIARGLKEKHNTSVDNEKIIALLVAFIWAVSVIVDMVNPSYETPIALHGLMGGIVGFYYKQKTKNEKSN